MALSWLESYLVTSRNSPVTFWTTASWLRLVKHVPFPQESPWTWKHLAPVTRLTTHHTTLCYNPRHHDANVQDFWNCYDKIMSCVTGERSWMYLYTTVGKIDLMCTLDALFQKSNSDASTLMNRTKNASTLKQMFNIPNINCHISLVTETRERRTRV